MYVIKKRDIMYSVIDIGSNTIRLVVYRVDSDGITPILNNK